MSLPFIETISAWFQVSVSTGLLTMKTFVFVSLMMYSSVFSNRVVDVWNSLPNAVVTALSLNAFKSRLNKHLHGHELKFNAPCYIPGETMFSNFVRRCSNGSLEVA